MKIIKNVNVYAPEKLGKKDILIAGGKICQISDNLDIPESWEVEVIDGEGLIATPGFIDSHVHILGGGGEGGFGNRTPEATLSGLTRWGITTVVGCLGTDGYG
ncbi:MAG: beta-aspartyl-peptidase, partial [Clostridia bacterium]|nr:beta-aspartyl-peptidase [Clostridia bacterium]